MTYEQTLENIKNILNFVAPIDDSVAIIFDFTSKTEFQIVIDDHPNWDEISLNRRRKNNEGLAQAVMVIDADGLEMLSYVDPNVKWRIDLITGETISSDVQGICVPNILSVRIEFLELIRKLKQM